MKLSKAGVAIFIFVVFAGSISLRAAKAQNTQQPFIQHIVNAGTTTFQAGGVSSDNLQTPEIDPGMDFADDGTGSSASPTNGTVINRTDGPGVGHGPFVNGSHNAKSNPELILSFDGLNHRNQRLANGGNQFSLEPPDQGLCAGNGFVVEAVNDVLRVYDTSGNPLIGVVDLNTFYGYPAAINRTTGAFGPEITDPSCYFDPDTQRWFVVVLTLDRVGTRSTLSGTNHLDLAVSTTSSPLGSFIIYRLPVQDDGTQETPNHNCTGGPCLGDYPHIGADANGFYMTTNEFNFFAPGFRASQIYAISKSALASGASSVAVSQFDTAGFLLEGNPGHTVWPSSTPASGYESAAGGTEYFLSSVARFTATFTETRLRVWALSNTQSLSDASPNLSLNSSFVPVNMYGHPPVADQKVGDIPLGDCINDTTTVITSLGGFTGCWKALFASEPAHNEVESNHVDGNDARMQQVVFANGKLWAALDTAVMVGGATKAGVAWYIVNPTATPSAVMGSVVNQGVLALANNNLTYPAVGVTAAGRGVIAFTLLGADNFPSAGYVGVDALAGAGPIHTAAAGLGPEDGFTAYVAEVGPNSRNRWGDYGAAVADGKNVWIASEYIGQTCTFNQYVSAPFGSCGGTRTTLGNWDTRISKITP
jgi:hypothetical protein